MIRGILVALVLGGCGSRDPDDRYCAFQVGDVSIDSRVDGVCVQVLFNDGELLNPQVINSDRMIAGLSFGLAPRNDAALMIDGDQCPLWHGTYESLSRFPDWELALDITCDETGTTATGHAIGRF